MNSQAQVKNPKDQEKPVVTESSSTALCVQFVGFDRDGVPNYVIR